MMLVLSGFFFKQMTAYEMRISDWSSDVCSSDLVVIIFLSQVPLTEIPRPVGAVNDLAERNFFQWQISWKRRLLQTGAGWYRTAVWLGNKFKIQPCRRTSRQDSRP